MESHLDESVPVMTVPLLLLAAGSLLAGFAGWPHFLGGANRIEAFLEPAILAGTHVEMAEAAHVSVAAEWMFMLISVGIAVTGIALAYKLYWRNAEGDRVLSEGVPGLYRALYHKYFVDEAYDATAVQGTLGAGRGLYAFDQSVVDGVVNGTAQTTVLSGGLSNLTDANLVDGLVNAVGAVLSRLSGVFRSIQTGLVQNYALIMLVGIFVLVAFYYFLL